MAPKKKGDAPPENEEPADDAEQPVTAEGQEEEAFKLPPVKPSWFYGINDLKEEVKEAPDSFKAAGNFKADFAAFCAEIDVIGHPQFMPTPLPADHRPPSQARGSTPGSGSASASAAGDADSKSGDSQQSSLAVQSSLLDRISLQVFRHVLPTSLHIQTLRFSGCALDVESLGILRSALGGESSTVATLYLEWNPVEVPLPPDSVSAAMGSIKPQEIDELEKQREKSQAKRVLQAFRDQMQARSGGDLNQAFEEIAKACNPKFLATAKMMPLDSSRFADALSQSLQIQIDDCQPVFDILDAAGQGDGLVSFDKLEAAISELPETNPDASDTDVVGAAFAAFIDSRSTLETVSFRCCRFGLLETNELGKALATSPHLRALNLWGNRIDDRCCVALAEALKANASLQFLGLANNIVTHQGLETLCASLGGTIIRDKKDADPIVKTVKDKQKEVEKMKKAAPPPKADANGRQRYTPAITCETCEELKDANGSYWLWTKNLVLKTLNLEQNPVADVECERLRPFGNGDLILRRTPCSTGLIEAERKRKEEAKSPAEGEEMERPTSAFAGLKGWNLILQ
eukprot:TRINITY_DN15760_c2_g1_i4.p1 TRINITY_DN15760_c2_g1~~TRINITY_DN15760_c2_g1_i4.p1  ORF type:complete len:574 (+),score=132.26 TRINITY_DN15760_c2_g1_i4:75-1796(+)